MASTNEIFSRAMISGPPKSQRWGDLNTFAISFEIVLPDQAKAASA